MPPVRALSACIAILAAILMVACATPIDIGRERGLAARALAVAAPEVLVFTRCQLGEMKAGARGATFRAGVCGATAAQFFFRPMDGTTGETVPGPRVPFASLDSVSLFEGVVADQFQMRRGEEILVVNAAPPGGQGPHNEAGRALLGAAVAAGVRVTPSGARINPAQADTVVVPLYLPRGK